MLLRLLMHEVTTAEEKVRHGQAGGELNLLTCPKAFLASFFREIVPRVRTQVKVLAYRFLETSDFLFGRAYNPAA